MTLTTRTVTPSGYLNTTSSGLGINAEGTSDESSQFDVGESWTFDWDVDTFFEGIDLLEVNAAGEAFTVQSNDWVNLAGVNPASSFVTYEPSTGTFTLTGGEPGDDFDLADLTGGRPLPVSAGTDVVIAFTDADGDGAGYIERMSWSAASSTAVPEPSGAALVLATLAVAAGWKGRKGR